LSSITLFPKFPKRGAVPVYLLITAGFSFCFALITTVNLIYQATVAGLTPLQLVLVGTLLEITCFFFEVPTGIVADVYSRRLSVIIGYALIGVGFLVEGLFPVFGAILLAQVIWGIGVTFTSGAETAWLIDEVGEGHSAPILLRASQVGSLGGLAGIFAAALIASVMPINIPIVIGAALLIALSLGLALIMPETGFHPAPRETRENALTTMIKTLRAGSRLVRGRPLLMVLFAVVFFGGLYSEGFDRLWTPHLLTNFTFPAADSLDPVLWFGALRAGAMIFSILLTEVVHRRTTDMRDQRHLLRAVFIGDAVLIGSLFVFALTGNFWIAVAAFLISQAVRSSFSPLFSAWSNMHIDSEVRATTLSMMAQMDAIGQIGGGPGIGVVGERLGLRAALAASTALLLPVLPLYALAGRLVRGKRLSHNDES